MSVLLNTAAFKYRENTTENWTPLVIAAETDSLSELVNAKVIYEDYSVSLANAGRTTNITTRKSGYTPVAANFNSTDSLYYLMTSDGIYPTLSINGNGDIQILGMNKSLQVNRTISVRVFYIKT